MQSGEYSGGIGKQVNNMKETIVIDKRKQNKNGNVKSPSSDVHVNKSEFHHCDDDLDFCPNCEEGLCGLHGFFICFSCRWVF